MSIAKELGRAAAKAGYGKDINPYGPGGCYYDGADSMGEALAWFNGWNEVLLQSINTKKPEKDDLDQLEAIRG